MKWIISLVLLCSGVYADYTSVERPNLALGREESKELLGNIDHKIGDLVNEFAMFKALFLEQQKTNVLLNVINDNLVEFIHVVNKSNELLEHLIWVQDHRISEVSPKKPH